MPKQTSPVIKMNGRNQMKNQLVSQFASLVKESVKEAEKNQVFNPEIPADIKLDLKSANNQLAYVRQQGSDLGKTFSDAFENGLKKSLTPNKDASVKELRQFRDQLSDQIKEMNKGFGKGGPTDYKQWKEFQGLIKAYENVNEELRKQILVQSNGLTSYSIPQKKADLSKILKIDLPELGNKARGEQIDEALKGLLKTALDNAEKAAQAEVQSVKDRINRFQTESALKQSGVGQKDTVRQLNAATKELENAKNIQAQTVDDVRKKLQELIGVYDSTGKKLDEIYEKDLNRLTIAEQDELTALEDKQDAVQQKFRAIYEWMMNVKGIDFGDLKQFKDFYDTIDTDRISSDNAQKQGFEQSIASSSETIKKTLALVKELQSHLGVLANIGHGLADLQGDDIQGVASAALDEQREQLEGERQLRQELEASNAQMVSRLEILEQSIKRCEELERQLTEANSIIEKYQSSGAVTPEESQAMQEELRTAKEQLELQKQARQELEASKADAEAKLQTAQRETDELKEQIKLLEEQENSGVSEDEYSALVQNYKAAGEQLQAVNKELETTRSELEKLKQADQQSEAFKEIGGPEKALEKIKAYEAQIQELEQKAKGLNATLDEVNQKLNDSVSKSDHSKELDQLRDKLNAAQKAAEDSDKLLADAKAQIAQKDTEIAALEAKANRSGVTGDGTMSAGDVGTLSDDIRNLNVLIDSLKGLYDEIQQKQSGLSSTVNSEVKDLELLDMALLEVTEDVDSKTNQFKREQDAVQASIGTEIGSLELLDAAILEVTEDVNNKTAQFQKESADVQAYIGKEIEDLRKLQHELESINTLLSDQSQTIDKNKGALSQLSQNAADGGVLIDIAALQTAADSLRDLIEGSINQHTKAFDVNVQKISQSSSAMSNVFKDITTAAQKVVDALQKIANPKDVYNDKKLLIEISGLRDAVSALRKSINNVLPKFTDLQNAFQPIIDAGQPTQNALTKVEEAAESAAKAIEGFGASVGAEASNANGQKRRGGNGGGGSNQEAATNLQEWDIEQQNAMKALRGAYKHQLEINDLEKRLAQDITKYNISPDQVNNIRSYLTALSDIRVLPSLINARKENGLDTGELEKRLAAQEADKDRFRASIPDGQFTGLVGEYVTQMMAHVEDIERGMAQFDNAYDTLEKMLKGAAGTRDYEDIERAIFNVDQYYADGFGRLLGELDNALGLIMARANAAKEDRNRKAAAKLGAQYAKEAERQIQREEQAEAKAYNARQIKLEQSYKQKALSGYSRKLGAAKRLEQIAPGITSNWENVDAVRNNLSESDRDVFDQQRKIYNRADRDISEYLSRYGDQTQKEVLRKAKEYADDLELFKSNLEKTQQDKQTQKAYNTAKRKQDKDKQQLQKVRKYQKEILSANKRLAQTDGIAESDLTPSQKADRQQQELLKQEATKMFDELKAGLNQQSLRIIEEQDRINKEVVDLERQKAQGKRAEAAKKQADAALKQANKKAETNEKQVQKQAEKDYQANLDKMLAQRTAAEKLLGKGDLTQTESDALRKAMRDYVEAALQISNVAEETAQMQEARAKYDRDVADMVNRAAAEVEDAAQAKQRAEKEQAKKQADVDAKQAQRQAEKDYQVNLDKMLAQRTTTAKLLGKGDLSQTEVDALQKAYRDFTEAHEQISRVGELTEQMREAQAKYDRALSDMLSRIAAEAKQQADITAKETQSAEQSQAEERYRELVRSATKQTETIISLTEKQKHSPLSNQEQNDLEKAQAVLWEAVEKIGQVTKKTDAMLKADQQFEEAAAQASVDIRARIADREAQLTNKYGNVQVSALGNPLAFSSSSDVSQYLKQYLVDGGVDFMRNIKFGDVDSATGLQRISVIFKDIDGIAKELVSTFNTVDGSLRMVINDTSETFEAEEKRGIAAYKVLQDTEKQYTKYLDKYVEYRKVLQDDSLDAESKEEKLKELQLTDEEISELDKLHKMREKQKEDLEQLSVLTQRLIEQQAIYEQERGQVDQGRSDNVREMQSWLDAQSSEKSIKEASDAEIKYITLTNQLIEAQKDLNALNEKSKHHTVVSDEDAKKVDALNHKIEELLKKLAAIRAQGFDGGVFDQKDAEYAEIMNTLPSGAQEAYERTARQRFGELVSGGIRDDVAARKALEQFAEGLHGKLIDIKFGKTKDDLQEITGIVDTMDGGFKKLNATMNIADGTLRTFTEDASMKETLGPLDIMLKNLASHQRSLISYLATFKSFYQIIDYAKRAAAQIKELDSAFVELRKVSNDSQAELEAFRSKAFSLGNNVGATGSQIIQAAAGWEQLGYSIDEASKLAQVSTIYQNVADGMESSSEATEDLISTLKAFYGGEASKAIDVVDALNEVSNNYAVSAADLGGILKRSSSSMAVANNSFEETLAMGTAMNEILQNQETAGATLKMLSLRIRGAKAELEEAGEEVDSMADSSSKLQEEIKGLTGGFDILEADGKSFKSTYEIMKGIAEVWGDMTDVSRAALLEKIAGKNRAQGVAQLLSNWSQVDKVLKTISEDEGSAERENRVRMESISGRITKLQNQGQELSTAIINADVFKEGISLVTEFVNLLTLAISKFGSFGIAAGVLGAGVSITTGGKGQLPARPLKRYVATRNEPKHYFGKAA